MNTKSIISNEKKHLSLSQFQNAESTNGSSVQNTLEKTTVTGLLLTKGWSLMYPELPSSTQYLKKLLESSKICMKLKGVSEPKFRHVHCNH